MNRRQFLEGVSAAAMLIASPARAAIHGSIVGASKRSIINSNGPGIFNFAFIDHFKQQDGWGPFGAGWGTGTNWNSAILDANGYPNNAANGRFFGGGIRIASSSNYSGNYIFDGSGDGRISFPAVNTGTYTVNGGLSSNVTVNANGDWTLTGGAGSFRVVFTYSGPQQLLNYFVSSTDPSANGHYLKNFRFYRADDETDLIAGNVFRAPWKQSIASLDPAAFRVMDWLSTNDSHNYRWENRPLPGSGTGYASYTNYWNASPPYTDTSGTNQWTVAAATGTPASMQHGELCAVRVVSGMVRATNGGVVVVSISKANPGSVNAVGHGFNTGDVVIIPNIAGMTQLNFVPLTITKVDADHFTIGIDTTAFSTYTTSSSNVYLYTTLQVGSGNDRTAYPILWSDPNKPGSTFGNTFISSGSYQNFYFDKTVSGKADTSGNWTMGAWLYSGGNPVVNPPNTGFPIEIVIKAINEINALNPRRPVDLWLNIPHVGLLSMDPDYSAASNWATKTINIVKNGNGSWPALTAGLHTFIESSNETWNGGFNQTPYLGRRGFYRWTSPPNGFTDFGSFASLRSMVMVSDIKAAFPGDSTLKFAMGMFSVFGNSGVNTIRIAGSSFTLTDALNPSAFATMAVHDYLAQAGYVSADDTTSGLAALTTSWVGNIGNATAQEANCASYVSFIQGPSSTQLTIDFYGQSILPAFVSAISSYAGTQVIGYEGGWDHAVPSSGNGFFTLTSGQTSFTYTGSFPNGDYIVADGVSDGVSTFVTATGAAGSGTLSSPATATRTVAFESYPAQSMFLRAAKKSTAWSNAWIGYFNLFNSNANAAMPADFIDMDNRWGHIWPSSYGTAFTSSTEYTTQDLAWQAMVTRNAGLS